VTTTAPATRLVAVGRVEDVPRFEGRPVTVAGRRIAIFNTPSGVRALEDACPHKGGPLSDGLVGDGCVVCPLHNRRIDLVTGEMDGDAGERAVVVPVVERAGWIYIEVAA
jgi:nitrite reductase (NADH) small subunit